MVIFTTMTPTIGRHVAAAVLFLVLALEQVAAVVAVVEEKAQFLDKGGVRKLDPTNVLDLPIWLTVEEKGREAAKNKDRKEAVPDDGYRHLRRHPSQSTGSSSSTNDRLPAEWEASGAVLLSWTGSQAMRQALEDIAVQVSEAGVDVWMVQGPTELPGVENYVSLPDMEVDSVWIRDYGPVGVIQTTAENTAIRRSLSNLRQVPRGRQSSSLELVDARYRLADYRPKDDEIPCEVASHASVACEVSSLNLDGGNIMTDGRGNLFMTSVTYEWNLGLSRERVDEILKDLFGVHRIHVLDYAIDSWGLPADGTGHIDMYAKLLDPCTVIVSQTTIPLYHDVMESAAEYFASLSCGRRGEGIQVHRVPAWTEWTNYYDSWFTYSNSLIVGDAILVPSYASGPDEEVKAIYEAAAPGRRIVMINSDALIGLGGAIHCVTMQVPAIP